MDVATGIAIAIAIFTVLFGGGGFYALFTRIGKRDQSIAQLEKTVDELTKKIADQADLKTEFALVRQALEALSTQWNAAEKNISALLAKDRGNDVELSHLQEEVGRLRDAHDNTRSEVDRLKAKID